MPPEELAKYAELHRVTRLNRFVVPLCAVENDAIVLVGTGFFVRMPTGEPYLVSAAHVLADKGEQLFYPSVNPQTGALLPVPLRGVYLASEIPEGKTREDDTRDIGVLKLPPDQPLPDPSMGIETLPFEELLPNAVPREGKYYKVVGRPAAVFTANPFGSAVIAIGCESLPDADYERSGFSPRSHLLLYFRKKRLNMHSGRLKVVDDPRGMSGCPVFWAHEVAPGIFRTPAVAVFTEYRPKKNLLIATDVGLLIHMLKRAQLGLWESGTRSLARASRPKRRK